MTKRLFALLATLVLASLLLAACGGGAAPEEPAAPAEEPMEEPMEEPTEAPAEEPMEEPAMYECTDPIGCAEIAPDEPVHIAYMLTISGATAFLGEDSQGAIEIAIDDRGGELLGHELQLTGEDSLCSAEGGQTAATKLASDPSIIGVIGSNCSSAATAAMPTISGAGLVMLSPSNTAPALTLEGETWQPGYFRICHTDLFQGSVAAEFAYNELGATTAATIHDGSPYADQLQAVFAGRFQELGGTITFQGAVNVGDTDMRTVLTSVAADSPDVLYFPIFEPEGPFIVAQSSEIAGLENTTLMGADGLLADSFPENAGPNAAGMYLSGPYVSGASYDEFLAKWDAKFGGVPPSGFHAFAYDGTNILLDAIEAVAVVQDDGTVYVPRQALRDAIAGVTDYTGLTGKLDCSDDDYSAFGITNPSHGDCATGEALGIFEITDAEITGGNWPPEAVYTP
jgi:branched-chain amino acid transport system substrate-binding protein